MSDDLSGDMLAPSWPNLVTLVLHLCSCQFVVKETGDYSVNAVDPDILVDWDLIEQVVSSDG